MKLRKALVVLTAVAVPITMITVFGGVASAKKGGGAINQPGTVSCNTIKGTITFNPPLTLSGSSPENANVKITVKGCSVTGGTVKPKKGTVSGGLTSGGNNNCTSLENSQPETLTVKWAPAGKINPTTASFSGYSVATNAQGDEGFSLPNSGGTGSTAGSYAQSSGVTATAYSNETSSQLASACGSSGGLKTLKLTSGSIG